MSKLLAIKIATTALDPGEGEIFKIATQIDQEVEVFNFDFRYAPKDPSTMKYLTTVYGRGFEKKHHDSELDLRGDFFDYIEDVVEDEGKVILVGHNAHWIAQWLQSWYKANEQDYFKYFHSHGICIISMAAVVCQNYREQMKSLSFTNVAFLCNIEYDQSDVGDEVKAVMMCYHELINTIQSDEY